MNVNELILGHRIEGPRLEYKDGWNPERVLHTMCAFANDIDDWGGGYIIVGVEFQGSAPVVLGLDRGSVDGMLKELTGMSNLLEPRYLPVVDTPDVDGRMVMVIWCPVGDRRPYSCPVRYTRDKVEKKDSERAYYIRKMSSTVRADRDDERKLFEASRFMPFDLSICPYAILDDIRTSLIREYLYTVGSSLYETATSESALKLFTDMRLVGGPKEDLRPLNIAIMFFNDDPDRFFRGAYVDVVYMPDPTGEGMEEYRFRGPLDRQIVKAMGLIEDRFVAERVYKSEDGIRARRSRSYPVSALRELLVNAVYHKSYEIPEPVRVTVRPDRIEFLNYPGPSAAVTDEDLKENRIDVGVYRNSRVGDYLKELGLAESRMTGLPKVVKALAENGSPALSIQSDPGRTYFRAVVRVHPDFTGDVAAASGGLEDRIESLLESRGCLSMSSICEALGLKHPNKRVRDAVMGMMGAGRVVYLYPGSPRSPKQRICLVKQRPRPYADTRFSRLLRLI